MTTLEDVGRQVIAAADSTAGYLLANQWVINRLTEIATRSRLRSLRQVGEVYIPAPITAGTATFTRDSAVVTGDATATAAWSPDVVGRHIRGRVSWCEIIGYQVVSGTAQLTLKSKFGEDTLSAGTYDLVQRFVPLDPEASWIGHGFVNMRRRCPAQRVTMDELDSFAPSRPRVGYGAALVVEGPELANGTKTAEFYPYSDVSESYRYVYWKQVPKYVSTDPLPSRIPVYVLREGALIDLYRYNGTRALNEGKAEIAATWFNMSRSQETKWDTYWRQAVKADRGDDDATFILKQCGIQYRSFDITNAYEQVLAQWR